jgi:acyl carrier protein
MEKEKILAEVTQIFHDVLDDNKIILRYETEAKDVKEWDSLTHIQLVVAIEKHFKLRFTAREIQEWKNVGEMIDCILKK